MQVRSAPRDNWMYYLKAYLCRKPKHAGKPQKQRYSLPNKGKCCPGQSLQFDILGGLRVLNPTFPPIVLAILETVQAGT